MSNLRTKKSKTRWRSARLSLPLAVLFTLMIKSIYAQRALNNHQRNLLNFVDLQFDGRDLQQTVQQSEVTKPLGQNQSFTELKPNNSLDLNLFQQSYVASLQQVIPQNVPSLRAHISTDKVVYKPGDTAFIEVYIDEAYEKVPLIDKDSFPTQYYNSYFQGGTYFNLNILDPTDVSIYSSSNTVENGTTTFTYQIPEDQVGGEFKIVITGTYIADTIRIMNIRQYQQQPLVVQVQFDQQAYNLGDTVNGVILVNTQDGSQFQQLPSYSYVVSFGNNQTLQNTSLLNSNGQGKFSFVIPTSTISSFANIGFTVYYLQIAVPYSNTLIIVQPENIVIDFSPETYNYVYGVPNKVYYQAYANDQRQSTIDLSNLLLLQVKKNANGGEQITTLQQNLSTINLGRGYFEFTPNQGNDYYLSGLTNNSRYGLNISQQVDIQDWEINFSVVRKVVGNDEDLIVRIFTNAAMLENDVYVLGIFNFERPVYLEQFSFSPNTSYEFTISANNFNITNGGVFRLTLLRVIRPLIWYERFEDLSLGIARNRAPSGPQPIPDPIIILGATGNTNATSTSGQKQNISERTQLNNPFYVFYSIPRGEMLFFKRPADTLKVEITTDKTTYMPGDLVNFKVAVKQNNESGNVNSSTEKNNAKYLSVVVTDNSVFSQVPLSQQPPSLPAMVLLEQEIYRVDYQFPNSNLYVDQWYQNTSSNSSNFNQPSDMNLDLLLGNQGWRYGFFFQQVMQEWSNVIGNMTYENLYLLESVLAYKFSNSPSIFYPYYSYANSISGSTSASGSGQGGGASQIPSPAPPKSGGAPSAPTETTTAATPAQSQATQLTLSQQEQMLWDFIKQYRQCNFQVNTRYYANSQRLSFLSTIGSRFDFTETLYFSSANYSASGVFNGQFILSDMITQFRISANGFDRTGRLGYQQAIINSQKPFYISFQLPVMMVQGDRLQIPIFIHNIGSNSLSAVVSIVDFDLTLGVTLQNENEVLQLASQTILNTTLTIEGLNITTDKQNLPFVQVRGSASSNSSTQKLNDAVLEQVLIASPGVLQVQQQSGFIGNKVSNVTFEVSIPSSAVPGTINFTVNVYLASYEQLITALKNIISQPIVCTYCLNGNSFMLVLALQAASNPQNPFSNISGTLIDSALSELSSQYSNLVSQQASNGGFPTYKGEPANLMATAENSLLIYSMKKVGVPVDTSVLGSAISWIKSQQNEAGNFITSSPYYQSQPQYLIDAFILWVLSSVGYTDIQTELDNLNEIAAQQMTQVDADLYFIGLLAATYYNLNQTEQAQQYADFLATKQQSDGSVQQVVTFFTNDQGNYLEATAMAAIVWQNDFARYASNIQSAVQYLVENTYIGYYYYPTVSSILSLQAIIGYLDNISPLQGSGDFVLQVNNVTVTQSFTSSQSDSAALTVYFDTSSFESLLVPGSTFTATLSLDNYVPDNSSAQNFTGLYNMAVTYDDTNPQSSNATQLALNVTSSSNQTADVVGAQANYTIVVRNLNQNSTTNLVIVVFRAPSCFLMNFNLFQTLKANGEIDMYEFKQGNTEVWIYFSDIPKGSVKELQIDLQRQFIGVCQERVQEAFQFYNPANPVWAQVIPAA